MKAIILFLIVIFSPIPLCYASSQKAYQDYLYQYDQYRLKLNNFHVARTEHLTYKTLLAETTALDTSRAMMAQSDDLLRSYILLLNEKINENNGMSDTDKKLYQTIIKNESSYLQTHKSQVASINSLSDAVKISGDLQTHYPILNTSVYQMLISLSVADLSGINKQFTGLQETFRDTIQSNRSSMAPEKQSVCDRWMIQIANKQNLYQQKIEQVLLSSGRMKSDSPDELQRIYQDIIKNLADAKKYLSEGVSYMQELANLLRYED